MIDVIIWLLAILISLMSMVDNTTPTWLGIILWTMGAVAYAVEKKRE